MSSKKVTLLVLLITVLLAQSHSKRNFISKLIAKTFACQEGNVIFSPLSVVANLGVAFLGSSGHTYDVFANVLEISEAADLSKLLHKILTSLNNIDNVALEIANKMYISNTYNLNQEFLNMARNDLLIETENVDFTDNAAEKINKWYRKKTKENMQEITSQNYFDGLTTLVLLNVIYFKSEWRYKFSETGATRNLFFLHENESRQVDMMRMRANVGYGENKNFDAKILELPYNNNKISMVIVLPNKISGILDLQQKLSNFDIDADVLSKIHESTVSMQIPKFMIESNIDLKQPLSEIGLEEIFTTNANFSRLLEMKNSSTGPYIGKMLQKARVEVNEEGSETAAATVGVLRTRQSRAKAENDTYSFIVNRPFLFFIVCRHQLGTGILFAARITAV